MSHVTLTALPGSDRTPSAVPQRRILASVSGLLHRGLFSPLPTYATLAVFQGEHLEVSPATPLLSQAVALGDRRTFSVYDLTQKNTFGMTHSLNLLIRWKSNEGEWEQ